MKVSAAYRRGDRRCGKGTAIGRRHQIRKNNSLVELLGSALTYPALWLSLSLTLNILEGALRKWVPGFESGAGRNVAYFSKDLCFLLGTFLVMSGSSRAIPALDKVTEWATPALVLILTGALISSIQGFSAVGSILSLRAMLVLPLFGYFYCSRARRFSLLGFAMIAVLLVLINALLSLIQNGLPKDHILNKYAAAGELDIVEVAAGVRATGTFAYITGLGVASALGVWGGMVLISLGKGLKVEIFGALGILSGLACAFASVSRGTVVIALTMLGLWALSSMQTSRRLLKGLCIGLGAGLMVTLLLPSIGERFLIAGEGAFDRFKDAGDNNIDRAFGQWDEMWQAVTIHPIGTGLGTEQIGGNVAAKKGAIFTQYETQLPRIVAEFGVLGLLGFFALVSAVVLGMQQLKVGGTRSWRSAVSASQVYVLGQFYGNLVFNHTGSAAVWLVVTAVFAAAPVARKKARQAKTLERSIKRIPSEVVDANDEMKTYV